MRRVVIFGATGNLGANISMHLHKLGYDVIPVGHRKNDNGFCVTFEDFAYKKLGYSDYKELDAC